MAAYYNEHDLFAAQWLRNLIAAGHIAAGEVDTRSIEDVTSDDLRGYQQCHFFAGIGVWSRALRDAGWPDDRMVWTGSCPCQPFSAAGKGAGFTDERHLWPAWHHLIGQRKPDVVLGEQVGGDSGAAWVDLVSADLEGCGYAFGSALLSAASFGSPTPRHRNYFVGRRRGADPDCRDGYWRYSPLQVGRLPNPVTPEKVPHDKGDKRPAQSRPPLLAYGVAARMELCRAYGNALDLRCAQGFVEAVTGALGSARF